MLKDGRIVSDKEHVVYAVSQYQAFKNPQGKLQEFITLGSAVTGGTLGTLSTYRIDNAKGKFGLSRRWRKTPRCDNLAPSAGGYVND